MALFTAIGTALGASATVAAGATVSSAFAVGLGASAITAGAVGYNMYTSDQQMRQAKASQSAMSAQMPISPAPIVPTQADAAKIAAEKVMDQRRSMARNESVYSNPLGIKDEAEVARKTLLGG